MEPIVLEQRARWLPADMDTPISLFKGLIGAGHGILLESAEVDGRWGRYSVLLCDMALTITCVEGALHLNIQDERLRPLQSFIGMPFLQGLRTIVQVLQVQRPKELDDLPAITRALYGYVGYGVAGLLIPKLSHVLPKDEAECCLVLPKTTLLFDHLYNRLCQISLATHRSLVSGRELSTEDLRSMDEAAALYAQNLEHASPKEQGYKEWVCAIKEQLRKGEAIQVVPSVRFHCPYPADPFRLYRRMRSLNASPYMFYMHLPGITLFGSSPEVMVGCKEGTLTLSPIAGTRRRGRDDREDLFFASELLNDPKERAEHVMLVDLGRNDLGRVAKPGSVLVNRFMQVERFSHVMHLTSTITASLREGLDCIDVLQATFPAGTVSGAPKIRAMELIGELEKVPRGPYAGCIGWLGLDRDSVNLDFGITIRSMWQRGETLYWQAGGGIVHDSDAELEWKEVCNKSAIMRLVLQAKEEDYVFAHR